MSYTRRFYTAGSGGGDAVGPLGVAAGGNSANLASAAAASPTGDMRWQLGALASAAASASTPLGFPGLADDADGRALDGVSVDATVPEPATILLFAAGLAALGLWRRAHRKKSRATTP